MLHSGSAMNRIPPPSFPFSLSFFVPFQVSVHSGCLCMEGEPGAADAQFWVLLAGVILSHTGPLINEAFVGISLSSGLGC